MWMNIVLDGTLTTIAIPSSLVLFIEAAVAAMAYGLAGYFHDAQGKGQAFDPVIFVKTVAIALIVAFVQVTMNLQYADALTFVTVNLVATGVLDGIINAIMKSRITVTTTTTATTAQPAKT
jgi:hypothetical protein